MSLNRRSFLRSLLLAPFAAKGIAETIKTTAATKPATVPKRDYWCDGMTMSPCVHVDENGYRIAGGPMGYALKSGEKGDLIPVEMLSPMQSHSGFVVSLTAGAPVAIGECVAMNEDGAVRMFRRIS